MMACPLCSLCSLCSLCTVGPPPSQGGSHARPNRMTAPQSLPPLRNTTQGRKGARAAPSCEVSMSCICDISVKSLSHPRRISDTYLPRVSRISVASRSQLCRVSLASRLYLCHISVACIAPSLTLPRRPSRTGVDPAFGAE